MAYSVITTPVTGTTISTAAFGIKVKDNFDAAFALGVDAWTSWTPTLVQSGAVTKTVTFAKYQRIGRTIHFRIKLSVTGTGTASNAVKVGLPVACVETADYTLGQGFLFDSSASASYKAVMSPAGNATELFLLPTDGTVANVLGLTAFTAALASGDVIACAGTYEAAS